MSLQHLMDMAYRLGFRIYVWQQDDFPNTYNLRDTAFRVNLDSEQRPS